MSYAHNNAKQVAEELGKHPELLYKWCTSLLSDGVRSFTGNGNKN